MPENKKTIYCGVHSRVRSYMLSGVDQKLGDYLYVADTPELAAALAFEGIRTVQITEPDVKYTAALDQPELVAAAYRRIPEVNKPMVFMAEVNERALISCEDEFGGYAGHSHVKKMQILENFEEYGLGTVQNWRDYIRTLVTNDLKGGYTADGYLQPIDQWISWGYTPDYFEKLGKWIPFEAIRTDRIFQKLYLCSEDILIRHPHFEIPLEHVTKEIALSLYPEASS